MIYAYLLLFFAVIAEIIATSALKISDGFSKLFPSVIVVIGYSIAFWLMSLALKTLPVSILYALWCGLGILGIAIIGVIFFKETFTIWHVVGTLFIFVGITILSLVTTSH